MNALPLITLQAIQIPQYRNDRLRSFQLWYRDNEPALTEYYNALRPYCEDGEPLQDFFEFAAIQHEREEMKAMECVPHGGSL